MKWLRGIDTPAWFVGLLRGVVEAAVMAGLLVLGNWLVSPDVPANLAPWAGVGMVLVRTIEGYADHIDPSKERRAS